MLVESLQNIIAVVKKCFTAKLEQMSPIRLLFSADYRVFHVFSYPLFCISSDLLNVLLLAKDRMDGSQTLEIPTVEKEDEEWDEEDED